MSFAENYVDVATRIQQLREKHPEASLQPYDPAQPFRYEQMGDQWGIVYVAACYRHPEDTRPGIGMAWEPVPGRTPYTKGSELMVAETSAWGRAIVAALAADTRNGIASADEVKAAQGAPSQVTTTKPPYENPRHPASQPAGTGGASEAQLGAIRTIAKKLNRTPPVGYQKLDKRGASDMIQKLQAELDSKAEQLEEEEPF